VTNQWFSHGTPVSSTNQTDGHDIADILLKVALNNLTVPTTLVVIGNDCSCSCISN
jgi:hypothetical protein